MQAFIGLWAGIVAVIATLKSTLAKAVSNGARIGDQLFMAARSQFEKPLYEAFPEHKEWVNVGLTSSCSIVGIVTSLLMVRLITAINSALHGANRLSEILMARFVVPYSIVEAQNQSLVAQTITIFFLVLGLNFQMSSGFSLPLIMRLMLLPFTLLETALKVISAY